MQSRSPTIRQEMIALLGRLVGEGPLPDDLRRQALAIFAAIVESPRDGVVGSLAPSTTTAGDSSWSLAEGSLSGATNQRLVYVHGICRHTTGFSNSWWNSLQPFLPGTFGPGILGQTRLEVVWSDLVNQAGLLLAAQAETAGATQAGEVSAIQQWQQASAEIKEALRDREDQAGLAARAPLDDAPRAEGVFDPITEPHLASGISIPGINCIDDFAVYLTSDNTRQRILDRFIDLVRPELQAGRSLNIIAHSWGTVVAYEGLRQLEDQGLKTPLVQNFFTVGAALSIPPVKMRLRSMNKDGKKPANTRRWFNLDVRGDIVGGPLKGRPYAVDADFVNLEPVGCNSVLGIVNPQCAHGSYFVAANKAVNRDIFANRIASL